MNMANIDKFSWAKARRILDANEYKHVLALKKANKKLDKKRSGDVMRIEPNHHVKSYSKLSGLSGRRIGDGVVPTYTNRAHAGAHVLAYYNRPTSVVEVVQKPIVDIEPVEVQVVQVPIQEVKQEPIQEVQLREVVPNAASTHIYVIHMMCEGMEGRDNIHKIGITNDIDKRLATLQTANPFDLRVVKCVPVKNPRAIEKALHLTFSAQRTRSGGEWFNVPSEDILVELDKLTNI